MKILVDADACPVKEIIVKIARELSLPVIMLIDTSHVLNDGYSTVIMVDKGMDNVDFALINRAAAGDIVVTQDYGLAAMALSKRTYVINQNGLIYTKDNIDKLLFERHLSKEIRRSGGKTKNPRKREAYQDDNFEKTFRGLCQTALKEQKN
jgi:uncharacterized protein